VARSLLPIHPICAAIQSVGIVKRDVEGDPSARLGMAVLPAVLLHGTFDFVVLALAVIGALNAPTPADPYGEQKVPKEFSFTIQDARDLLISAVVAAAGVLYYLIEARKQRGRLSALEATLGSSTLSLSQNDDNEQ